MPNNRWPAILSCVIGLIAIGCRPSPSSRADTATTDAVAPIQTTAAPAALPSAAKTRDLSIDESMGGHTLVRHVGRTDADLRDRLRRERDISAASTYTDRATAERVVQEGLDAGGRKLEGWLHRTGRRPNLALSYTDRSDEAIGLSLSRGSTSPLPCHRAIIVVRWDERLDRFYVLTSYPEADQ